MFFSAQYNALVCFLVSPTPTAIPTMTHRPEEDTFGVSVLFSPEIESTYMKYNEVSQEHMVKVLKTNPILNHLSFHSFSFSHCTAYLPAPLWLVFYNFLSTFVHLCAVIDWIQIIFSSEDFNRDSAQRVSVALDCLEVLITGKSFLLQIALFQQFDCYDLLFIVFILCLSGAFRRYIKLYALYFPKGSVSWL